MIVKVCPPTRKWPARVALPFPVLVRVTPAGSEAAENVGAGNPLALTVRLKAFPTLPALPSTLVMAGAWSTVSVNACLTSPDVLVAVNFTLEYTRPVRRPACPPAGSGRG